MPDIITINLKLGRKGAFLATLLAVMSVSPSNIGGEALQVTTYYPTPYGTHDNVRAYQSMQIFKTNDANSHITIKTSGSTVTVAAPKDDGILYLAPTGRFGVNGSTITLTSITFFAGFCKVVADNRTTGCSSLPGTWVMMASSIAEDEYLRNPADNSLVGGLATDLDAESLGTNMLCCRWNLI
ncbi:MAG: hypothetical protein NTW04_00680 [Elusimicrobia bacterium]|nr:hypothetical protein [Elusimicrobiota bacterium]